MNVLFFLFKEKRNRPGCPTVDVGKRLCRYRPAEGERAEFLLIYMYLQSVNFFNAETFVGLKDIGSISSPIFLPVPSVVERGLLFPTAVSN